MYTRCMFSSLAHSSHLITGVKPKQGSLKTDSRFSMHAILLLTSPALRLAPPVMQQQPPMQRQQAPMQRQQQPLMQRQQQPPTSEQQPPMPRHQPTMQRQQQHPMQRYQPPASEQQAPMQRQQPPPMREPLHRRLLQSQSIRTWSGGPHQDQADVSIGTNGRPLDAEVEVWEGPGNTPVRTRVWSEDGYARPFRGMVHPSGPHSVAVRNTGPLEFPVVADVAGDLGPTRPSLQWGAEHVTPAPPQNLVVGDSSCSSDRIQGSALRTFRVDAVVDSVEVRLQSEGMPVYASIEVLQGPNAERQVIDVVTDNGRDKPISYILETPGYGSVISIKNTWPSMEYPLTAHVVPHAISPGYEYHQLRPDGLDAAKYGGYGDGYGGVGHGGYDPQSTRGVVVPSLQDQQGRLSGPDTRLPSHALGAAPPGESMLERRIDEDGGAYTKQEYLSYYGEAGHELWESSQPLGSRRQ